MVFSSPATATPVPQAGKFYKGANLDRGPSDLALEHTLLLHGTVSLPQRFEVSGIFRAQSGFGRHVRNRAGEAPVILVVEDEPITSQVIGEILTSGGYLPLLAANGKKAQASLSSADVRAVLLDLMMPEMDGFELLRRLREDKKLQQIPVFVLTAKDLTEAERELLSQHAQSLFRKQEPWKNELLTELGRIVPVKIRQTGSGEL